MVAWSNIELTEVLKTQNRKLKINYQFDVMINLIHSTKTNTKLLIY